MLLGPGAAVSASEGEPVAVPLAHEFYFTRVIYGGQVDEDFGPRWAVDYPKADQQFLIALKRLSGVDAFPSEHALKVDTERLHEFPFLYVLEVGSLTLSDAERTQLRNFLMAGGFMVVDDFWGSWEWENFEAQMRQLLPEFPIVEVPLEHPVFHAFYDIPAIVQVPNVYQGTVGGQTHEYDGVIPRARGIFDAEGRLMVLINWNTDLGDGWEWADHPQYPLKFSTYAYEMGINFVIYGMTY